MKNKNLFRLILVFVIFIFFSSCLNIKRSKGNIKYFVPFEDESVYSTTECYPLQDTLGNKIKIIFEIGH